MVIKRNNVGNAKDEWQTPVWLFNLLNEEFHFDVDVAANNENAVCRHFYGPYPQIDSLVVDWTDPTPNGNWKPRNFFMNPPYSGHQINKFMAKAYRESLRGATVVCLVPVSSDTQWWHRNVMEAQEIRFIEGRVDYIGYDPEGNLIKQSPTFPSCVVIFDLGREKRSDYDLPVIGKTITKSREP
jgi:site-specific DNA-methyltransferase (adenine-specific)